MDPLPTNETTSPEWKALNWLVNDDERTINTTIIPNVNAQSIIQRYALAVIYFATEGDTSWATQCNFLSSESECQWNNGISSGASCGGGGVDDNNETITRLDLRK